MPLSWQVRPRLSPRIRSRTRRLKLPRLADKVDELAARLETLDEDLNEAQAKVSSLSKKIQQSQDSIAAADAQAETLRGVVRDQAIATYMRGSSTSLAATANVSNARDSETAKQYAENLLQGNNDALDSLRALHLAIEEQRAELDRSKNQADEAASNVARKLDQVKQARAEQSALLKETQGELATLIAAEQRRRAEAEATRVRQQLEARRAAQQARTVAAPRPGASPSYSGPAPGASAPAPNARAGAAVAEARKQLGKPYNFASSGPGSFDCSGLTAWAWSAAGVGLPHSSRTQYSVTTHIDVNDIKPGDLVFFGRPIHHVGIYVGDGQMVEAPHSGAVVRYASIYRRDLVGVGRVS